MISQILLSNIIHKRFIPFKHTLKYNVPSLYLNIDHLEDISKKYKFFSINAFNIFSFYEIDHGYRDRRTFKSFVKDILKKYKINYKKLNIMILCFPRIIGYGFDPLSIIYCFDGEKLISILYEVKNTTNEQHTYIFKGSTNSRNFKLSHQCSKQFYVSPFIEMDAYYKFFNKLDKNRININIDLYDINNHKVLTASQNGKFIELNSKNMFKFLTYNPLLGFKVIVGILFESIKIVIKGGKYYARKKKPNDTISFEGNF